VLAQEPADLKANDHPLPSHGQISDVAPVATVDTGDGLSTIRAQPWRTAPGCVNHQYTLDNAHLTHCDPPVGE
jgi:hypothetical protein